MAAEGRVYMARKAMSQVSGRPAMASSWPGWGRRFKHGSSLRTRLIVFGNGWL